MCHNQSVFQVIGYKSRRKLDTLMLFHHFILYCILYYVVWMNNDHYDVEIACFEPISDAYVLCLTLGLDNHLNAISLTS